MKTKTTLKMKPNQTDKQDQLDNLLEAAALSVQELLGAHIIEIRDLAMETEDNLARVGIVLNLDFSKKVPTGTVVLGFSKRVKDEAAFTCPDPDQAELPGVEHE